MTATKDMFFKADRVNHREKAGLTDATVKGIVLAEGMLREQKTQRLRALRLEREAAELPEIAPSRKRASSTGHDSIKQQGG